MNQLFEKIPESEFISKLIKKKSNSNIYFLSPKEIEKIKSSIYSIFNQKLSSSSRYRNTLSIERKSVDYYLPNSDEEYTFIGNEVISNFFQPPIFRKDTSFKILSTSIFIHKTNDDFYYMYIEYNSPATYGRKVKKNYFTCDTIEGVIEIFRLYKMGVRKYLKLNESNQNLFEKINGEEFVKDLKASTIIDLDDKELEYIEIVFQKHTSKKLITSKEIAYISEDDTFFDFHGYSINGIIFIHKTNDEFYYFNENFEEFYRCDTFEGLKNLIRKLLDYPFYEFNTTKKI